MLLVLLPVLCAILSGCLLALAFPLSLVPFELHTTFGNVLLELPGMEEGKGYLQVGWVAFVAVIPLLAAIRRAASPLAGGLLAYLTAFVWLFAHWNWMQSFGWLPVILLATYFGVPYALFGTVAWHIMRRNSPGLLQWGIPLAWVGLEYARSFGGWSYPWNFIGYSQSGNLPFIQATDLAGVYLISFIIVCFNVALYLVLSATGKPKLRFGHALLGLALLPACLAYGEAKLAQSLPQGNELPYSIGLVQGGLGTLDAWADRDLDAVLDVFLGPTSKIIENHEASAKTYPPDLVGPPLPHDLLVVWPESCIPRKFSPRHLERLPWQIPSSLEDHPDATLLIGTIGRPVSDDKTDNGSILIGSDGELHWVHSKIRLVPFGEVVPFREMVRFLPFPWGDYNINEGRSLQPYDWRGRKLGALICYDNVFPFICRSQARSGAGSFIMMTNNSWYDLQSGIRQHCNFDVFRAIEFRRPVARVSTTGWSQIVDPYGHTLQSTVIDTTDTIEATIIPRHGTTVYQATGDLFAQLCTLAAALLSSGLLIVGRSEGML